jgi:hypothetical protein
MAMMLLKAVVIGRAEPAQEELTKKVAHSLFFALGF